MDKILQSLKKELLEVYTDEDINKFDVGYLVEFDDIWLLLRTFDSYGLFDGFMLVKRESVCKINYDTQYLKNLTLEDCFERNLQIVANDGLLNGIFELIENKKVASITLINGDTFIGIINNITDNYIKICIYSDSGKQDGYTIVDQELVSCIQFDNRECINIRKNIDRNA